MSKPQRVVDLQDPNHGPGDGGDGARSREGGEAGMRRLELLGVGQRAGVPDLQVVVGAPADDPRPVRTEMHAPD